MRGERGEGGSVRENQIRGEVHQNLVKFSQNWEVQPFAAACNGRTYHHMRTRRGSTL